ncbi:MAG: Trehalose synthase [uncultured Thermomicrobiales bacterium]|uniref:Trehalose synthase n=1 Tax=uncultured Thermomicrobiales bacterium TaxID=1645740 RepID=A0A6J4UWJ1_9BACT|nr:MAG: Trehalose synthase [uncultured Thermomicrobiales bacterium]
MQWSAATKRLSHPILDDPRYAPARVNVADQRRDPDALFNWLGQLIRERKERPEFGWGRCQLIETENPAIFAHRGDWDGGGILVIHNLVGCHTTAVVSLGLDERLTEILSDGDYEPPLNGGQGLELVGYSYRWFRIRRDGQRILA